MIYGIDIGGTKIEFSIFSTQLEPVKSWRVSTPTQNYEHFLALLKDNIFLADSYIGEQGSVGLGLPGLVDPHGICLTANVPCANGKNVARDLAALVGREIHSENDCRCFALSEAIGGAGSGHKVVFGAILGTGAAGGLCIDGKLFKGRQNIVGEYGHSPLPYFLKEKYKLNAKHCGCGLNGCLEQFIAGPGLANLYKHFTGKEQSTREIIAFYNAGNQNALNTIECYLDILGYTFSTVVHNYDPEVIVLGGGMSNVPEITARLAEYIKPYLFSIASCPTITVAKYGDSSGVRGAAILAAELKEKVQ